MSKEDILLFSCYGMRGEGKSYYEKMKEKDKEIERLKNINEEHRILNGELRVENSRSNNIINELSEKNRNLIEDNMRLRKEINLHGGKLYISDIEVKEVWK